MRISSLVARSAAMIAVVFPVLAFAQFQQPTPDELKMTSDPQAPGAAAVYLNLQETADESLHYESFYARIKVLTEKGKELATVSVPYGGVARITDIKARTIHPDGTIVPLEGKPEDLLTSKSGDEKFGRKVFTLPSVEVGSILEYRYDMRYPDEWQVPPRWDIQQPYFVHKAHYAFTPFKAFLKGGQNETNQYMEDSRGKVLNMLYWWANLPKGAAVNTDAIGRFSLDVTDIPPIPDEEFMPPMESVLYKVWFYYKGSYTAEEFWQDEAKQWSKDVDHFAEPSGAIHAAVNGIVTAGDSDLDKAKKLYDAVEALDNTDYSREKSQSEMKQLKIKVAKRAEDTWAQKSGNSENIALLYLAMLRAAGVEAYAMKVKNRDNGAFDPTYMESDQFDDTLVILENGGKEIVVDPGEKMCPFRTVSWRHSDVGGMRESAKGGQFAVTPKQIYTDNATVRAGELTLDEHGAVTGSLNFTMTGQEAMRWRQTALENDDAEVKKRFDHELQQIVPDGIDAHVDHFLGMDKPDLNLMAIVKVSGSMGAATSKRRRLPGFFFESQGHTPFVKEEKRQTPVDMQYADRITDQVTYHLPAGVTVEVAPQDGNISWQGHAVCVVKTKNDPGQLIVARSLARGFDQAKPEEYQDLRGFYTKVASNDGQQIVLRAATVEKASR
jgi:Domain of Unknown Function with PDB structure (DUF3857)/Transglutaminase-like superfamily